jgi:hypothetical protein
MKYRDSEEAADIWMDWWKDEGKREQDELVERMCRDAEAEDRRLFPELFPPEKTQP